MGRTGFIGLGMMGLPMSIHLARAGMAVCACDVRADAVNAALAAPGVTAADTPQAVAEACAITFTCLPGPETIRRVYLGDRGLTSGVREGSIVCELSTTSPELSAELQQALASHGAEYVEATMIGPPSAAAGKEVFFVVGGHDAALSRLEPLLLAMGRGLQHVGPVGAASRAKLLHNALGMIHAAATCEVLAMCFKVGVDPDAFVQVVKQAAKSRGIGYSTFFDLHASDIVNGRESGAGRLYIGAKDAHLARLLAESVGYPAPLLREADGMFEEAMRLGWGEREYTVVAKVIERRLGEAIFRRTSADPLHGDS